MATSYYGKDDSKYVLLKAPFHAKSIKTLAKWQYFEWTAGVQCQRKVTMFKLNLYR